MFRDPAAGFLSDLLGHGTPRSGDAERGTAAGAGRGGRLLRGILGPDRGRMRQGSGASPCPSRLGDHTRTARRIPRRSAGGRGPGGTLGVLHRRARRHPRARGGRTSAGGRAPAGGWRHLGGRNADRDGPLGRRLLLHRLAKGAGAAPRSCLRRRERSVPRPARNARTMRDITSRPAGSSPSRGTICHGGPRRCRCCSRSSARCGGFSRMAGGRLDGHATPACDRWWTSGSRRAGSFG